MSLYYQISSLANIEIPMNCPSSDSSMEPALLTIAQLRILSFISGESLKKWRFFSNSAYFDERSLK